jgi:raffinose/stachyose/melibiose transport system permease protein
LAPALIAFLAFLAIPLVLTFGLSFVNWSGITLNTMEWAGLSNYTRLLHDPLFWHSLRNNMIFLVLGLALIVALGLFVAVLLEQGFPGSKFFRGVFFVPTVLSLVVVGIVFSFLLDPTFGVLKPTLGAVGIQAEPAPLAHPGQVLYTLIALESWRAFGFAMFLFVAGLKALDHHLTEAARIDGASGLQIFWHVTLPQLRPVTLMVSTLVGIGMLRLFDIVYVMTSGGPDHASEVLNTYSYAEAFSFSYIGYGSTIAVVMLFVTFMFTILRFKVLPDQRREARRTP